MSLTVNGQTIVPQLIADEMERLRPEYEHVFKDMSAAERETQLCAWATENVIERTLLHQHARTCAVEVPESEIEVAVAQLHRAYENPQQLYAALACTDDEQVRAYTETSLKAERFLAGLRDAVPAPENEQIEQYYRQHPERYQMPERLHAAHIVMHVDWQQDESTALARLQAAQAELRQGKPFHLVAARCSDCPENSGDLGFFARGQMVEEVEDVLFNLGPGQVTDIFRSRYGLHIATVYQRESAATSPLKDVRDRVIQELIEQCQSEAVYAFIDTLKAQAEIVSTVAS
jgi:hypothetical protein